MTPLPAARPSDLDHHSRTVNGVDILPGIFVIAEGLIVRGWDVVLSHKVLGECFGTLNLGCFPGRSEARNPTSKEISKPAEIES